MLSIAKTLLAEINFQLPESKKDTGAS